MSWQQILINIAITLAAALLTALGSWVLVKVKNLVATKIKNTKTQALLLGAVDVVASVVKLLLVFQVVERRFDLILHPRAHIAEVCLYVVFCFG